ncbi:MAG: DNA polymerase I [Candidatus Andersenbacteria bacterium]
MATKVKVGTTRPRFLIFDGNSIVHRAYHALPPTLTAPDGTIVNAAFGFTSILLKAIADLKPTYVAVAWDYPADTFRDEIYADYKATRQKTDDALHEQFPLVKKIVSALNIPLFERKGFEADDMLGTLSTQANRYKDIETYLVTSDKDAMQLVDDRIKVYTTRQSLSDVVTYDRAAVKARFGLTPEQLIDFKALRGDPSDNIPGVRGVGDKTASALIGAFATLEALYEALEKAQAAGKKEIERAGVKAGGKLFQNLLAHKKDAYLSKQLVTIKRDVPVTLDLAAATLQDYDRADVVELFSKLRFKSLVPRLPRTAPETAEAPDRVLERTAAKPGATPAAARKMPAGYHRVDSLEKLTELIKKLEKVTEFALDTETTALGPMGCELVGLSFCAKDGESYYVPVGHKAELGPQCELQPALKLLKPLLENPKVGKIGHNIKYDVVVLKNYGIEVAPVAVDTLVVSYVLDPGRRQASLESLAFAEFGYEMMPIEACIGTGRKQCSFSEVEIDKATFYAAEDADYTWRLAGRLRTKLKDAEWATEVWEEIERPLVPILAEMEFKGVVVDTKLLGQLAKRYVARADKLKQQIQRDAKGDVNINSPAQLAEVLFVRLGLPTTGIKKTQSGYSTAATELEKLKGQHPIIDRIGEYRELTKLVSTYLEALPEMVNPATHRVHTSYNQAVAATGRLSSSDPNLQNIPVRTELGNEIRKAFVAPPMHTLVALDYSQIELRIAAHLSRDPGLIAAFTAGQDIHAATAARVLHKDIADVTKAERNASRS